MRPIFKNQPATDFSVASNRDAFQRALGKVCSQLGANCPMYVDGKTFKTDKQFDSISPADPDVVVGQFPSADAATALQALEAADRAFPSWSRVPARDRASFLFAVAAEVRKRRLELCAWMVYEVGKSWDEADGEVAECVDLMEYYGQQALRLSGSQTLDIGRLPDETTDFFYVPLGAGVIISPWNFPMALTFGMAGAAVVAGNTVVIKPASTSPTSVYQVFRIFQELGLPPGVMNLVTGSGGTLGDPLIEHPRTRFVAFTGSMEVGIHIHERAAKVQPGQVWIKRTVLEMGGKNAVIVDSQADLDLAADAVVAGAFSFQGQKCSAGSRAIIDRAIYEEFVPRVVERAARLTVGNTVDPAMQVGPVIDHNAFEAVSRYIEIGRREGDVLLGGEPAGMKGYFIRPTIFGNVDRNATIAQEEIFGPVLACIPAKDFDDALAIANGTRFGLTGAVISRNRMKLERPD